MKNTFPVVFTLNEGAQGKKIIMHADCQLGQLDASSAVAQLTGKHFQKTCMLAY